MQKFLEALSSFLLFGSAATGPAWDLQPAQLEEHQCQDHAHPSLSVR